MSEDDRCTVAGDDEDTADDPSENRIGTAIALHPIVYPTTANLYSGMLAMAVHTEGT
jgi:hypothetical protein